MLAFGISARILAGYCGRVKPSNLLASVSETLGAVSTMAHLLKALGEAALRPQKVRGLWHKPAISGRVAGELRRAALLEGREWPYDLERPKPKKHGLVKKLKGHKHEAESRIRHADVERRMAEMPKKIADYRKASKPKEPTLLESLTTTAKERKLKARGV